MAAFPRGSVGTIKIWEVSLFSLFSLMGSVPIFPKCKLGHRFSLQLPKNWRMVS